MMNSPECDLCGVDRVDDNNFCWGCHEYICDECSLNEEISGLHEAVDHLLAYYDNDDDYPEFETEYETEVEPV